jgi:hypothetical protein
MMAGVQLFHAGARSKWDESELADALESASAHVRYLLKELSEKDSVKASELKSKRVAYAIVQRICNSSGKDSLVLVEEQNGEKVYSLNPKYRRAVTPLVAEASEPPPTPAKPKRKKPTGYPSRGRRGMSATDGIADPSGRSFAIAPRQFAQTTGVRSLAFPDGVTLDFCQELISFLNTNPSGRYRIVLDGAGPRLELA